MTPTNRMTPEQAAAFKRGIHGRTEAVDGYLEQLERTVSAEKSKAKERRPKKFGLDLGAGKGKPRELIPTAITCNTETRCSLQIACNVPSQVRDHRGRFSLHDLVRAQRAAVWSACTDLLGWEEEVRARIIGVTFVRISSHRLFEHDNLPASLKNVVDAWCSYAEHGSAVLKWTKEQTQLIGRSDDNVVRTAETPWNRVRLRYAQEDCEWNSKLHGVRIHMTLLRRGQRWTPYTTHIAQRRRRSARKFRTASGLPTSDRS